MIQKEKWELWNVFIGWFRMVKLLYSHSHNDINNNSKYTYAKTQVDTNTQATPLFRYECFINFWLWFLDTRRETILKSLLYHTMQTISLSELNFSTSWSDPNFNCLPQWQTTQLSAYIVQSQLPTDSFSKSSNSQDHRFWAWCQSHSSLVSYLGFIMLIVIVISFLRERKLYLMLYTWTKSWIVQSPTKLNYKI